CTQSLDFPWTF
nr:immunoglobulin light chain junction region [Macaca mulatta]